MWENIIVRGASKESRSTFGRVEVMEYSGRGAGTSCKRGWGILEEGLEYHGRALEYRQICRRGRVKRWTHTMTAGMDSVLQIVVGKGEG